MLRRNPQSGVWERREGDEWVPAHNVEGEGDPMDMALDEAFSDNAPADADSGQAGAVQGELGEASTAGTATAADAPVATAGGAPEGAAGTLSVDLGPVAQGDAAGSTDGTGGGAVVAGDPDVAGDNGDTDWTIPGLVSTESGRGTGGQKGLRKRLQERARGKRGAQAREPKKVEVGPRAAKAVGPAVKDSTEQRQTKRRVRGAQSDGAKPQRYVSKPPPALLGSRPRWMQDLFEAHFRSELTLGLRREHNRMKISRTDYAIGWLTLMDKLREDPSIARLKEGKNGKDA